MDRLTICAVGSEVRGGAQRVDVTARSMPELLSALQRQVEFTVPDAVLDAVSLFDAEFEEYVLVRDLSEIPRKAKLRLSIRPHVAAERSPSGSAPTAAAAFYSDVCEAVLLPAIEELTGANAASLAAMLNEAYVQNPADPHSAAVSKLQSAVQTSVLRAQHRSAAPAASSQQESALSQQESAQRRAPPAVSPLQQRELFPAPASNTQATRRTDEPAPARANKSASPAASRKSAPPEQRKAAAPSPAAASAAAAEPGANGNSESLPIHRPDVIIAYCVYTGVTSQRAKAVRISRYKPSLRTLLAVLQDKFKSSLSLGYIEADGSYSELLLDEDLEAVVAKLPPSAESVTLHCWTQASAEALDLAYCNDIASRATTPSGKSLVSAISSRKSAGAVSVATSRKSTKSVSKPLTNPLDVSGVCYTEDHLRELFDELDVDKNGYLDKDEMRRLFFERYDAMGVQNAEQQFENFLRQCGAFDDGKVTYDEFAIVMLKLAQW